MKRRTRYRIDGTWYKGNIHLHTTRSDGGLEPAEIAEKYAKAGYDFIFITDHMRAGTIEKQKDLPLLALNGIEIEKKKGEDNLYHVLGLGFSTPIPKDMAFEKAFRMLKAENSITVLAHPHWTGNSVADALAFDFDGVEVYNHVCRPGTGKSYGVYHWDCMLEKNQNVLGFASDDAHLRSDDSAWNGGWIMVNAPRLDKRSIISAIRKGNFYATQGPEIKSIEVSRSRVHVETSPVRYIRIVRPRWNMVRREPPRKGLCTEAEFNLSKAIVWGCRDLVPYMRIEIEDSKGRSAWTNTLYRYT